MQISKPLTTPATFQVLTGIIEPDEQKPSTGTKEKFGFSQDLLDSVSLPPFGGCG